MDLLGYAALGGLERFAIIVGAVVIGYWGYKLYTAEKNAGLVFMALAVVVLAGTLISGPGHVRNVGAQLASARVPEPLPQPAVEPVTHTQFEETRQPPGEMPEPSPFLPSEPATDELAAEPPPAATLTAPEAALERAVEPAPVDEVIVEPAEEAVEPTAVVAPVRLATGQELGGRIVSVKSENVMLEWSSDSD